MSTGEIVAAIAAERDRQVSEEGYSAEHDAEHDDGELAWAAACYAAPGRVLRWDPDSHEVDDAYPWGGERPGNHGKDRVRDLIKAAALCVAEIERLQRSRPCAVDGADEGRRTTSEGTCPACGAARSAGKSLTKGVYRFHCSFGRQGDLDGVFAATHDAVRGAMGVRVYFGEVLGKHSDVALNLKPEHITLISDDLTVVELFEKHRLRTGLNPFQYLSQEDDQEGEGEGE